MRNIKIVADSSCDMFSLKSTPFATAPMKVITNDREFVDDEGIDVSLMVDYLGKYKGRSKSSCPNTADWLAAFGDADEVFCVTITSGLSGSYNSALVVARLYEQKDTTKRVFVIDTLSAGPELTLIIEKLEQLISDGLGFDEICGAITDYTKKTGLIFMLKSLKNFANNGRVSPIVAKLIGIAGICIVGRASEVGTLEPMHKCRGERRSLETLVSELEKAGFGSGKISIGHCRNEAAAKQLSAMILEKFKDAKIEIHPFRGLCSFYAEDGGVLVGYERD
jgi:DegV family protein with EDD domain